MKHMKAFILLAAAALVVVWSFTARAQTTIPTLKAEAAVTSDLVRIGDILTNAGEHAGQPIFRAPELGSSGTIQVHRVMEALRGHGIIVFDTRNLTEVLITRESRTLSLNDLSRAVADAAGKRFEFSNVADLTVAFDSHMKPLQIEPSVTDAPKIGNITYDPRTNRFDATIDMPGSMKLRRSPVRLTGTLVETTEVVTLARPISRSEIIRESDLVIERLARAEIPTDAITKLELVVNQAARRALRTGQTLRVADLMKPQIVTRDEGVTIVFRSGGITLTMRGKAMNNGAEGDSIPVLNPQSKRVVQATVTGPGVVTVGDINPLTTAAINNNR